MAGTGPRTCEHPRIEAAVPANVTAAATTTFRAVWSSVRAKPPREDFGATLAFCAGKGGG